MTLNDECWEVPVAELYELKPRQTPYCIAIPVINEGERIRRQLQTMKKLGLPELADILILDGGSTDGSMDLNFLRAQSVRVLLVKKGPGKLSAQLRMGYAFALCQGYKGIITVDGNGKDDVQAIPRFIAELEAGCDLVQGSRYVPHGRAIRTPWLRTFSIRCIHAPLISVVSGFRYTDTTNGFRGYSRRFLLDPHVQPFREIFDTYELLAYLSVRGPRLGYKVKEVPVSRQYPTDGKVPTKITNLMGNIGVLLVLIKAISGSFNPRSSVS